MAKKRKPSRSAKLERRKLEQKNRKLVADRERLFLLSAGGSPERPFQVDSPVVIEGRARAVSCPQCQGPLHIDEHEVERETGEMLRRVLAHCRECGSPRRLWFRIVMQRGN